MENEEKENSRRAALDLAYLFRQGVDKGRDRFRGTVYPRFEQVMSGFFSHQRENPDATIEESWIETMDALRANDELLTKFLTHCSRNARGEPEDYSTD